MQENQTIANPTNKKPIMTFGSGNAKKRLRKEVDWDSEDESSSSEDSEHLNLNDNTEEGPNQNGVSKQPSPS